jgi:hypothetical protein
MSETFDLRLGKSFWMNLPNNLYIDVEISMNDAISQADDLAPLNLGTLGFEILRQTIGGFTDDF